METKEIRLYEIPLTIHFTVSGQYYAATREQPEEHAEVLIEKITASDSEINLIEIFTERQLELIYQMLDNG